MNYKKINIIFIMLIILPIINPYFSAAEIVVDEKERTLEKEIENGVEVYNSTKDGSNAQIDVSDNKAYKIASSEDVISVDGTDIDLSTKDTFLTNQDFVTIQNNLDADVDVYELATEVSEVEYDITDQDSITFFYTEQENVEVSILVDDQMIEFVKGSNTIDTSEKTKVTIRLYDPLGKIDSLDQVLKISSNSDSEEDSEIVSSVDDSELSENTSEVSSEASEVNSEVSSEASEVSRDDEERAGSGYDYGDAPSSYGAGKIELGEYNKRTNQGFYLGFDAAGYVGGDSFSPSSGLEDDKTPSTTEGHDDETGFLYKVQDEDGKMVFNSEGQDIHIIIPYDNANGYAGQIGVWIDFDANGSYDADEFVNAEVKKTQKNPNSVQSGTDNYYRNSVDITIPVNPDVVVGDTYMRVVLIDNKNDISRLGNSDSFSGKGEVEDYPVEFVTPTMEDTCSTLASANDPSLNYETLMKKNNKDYVFVNIDSPYTAHNIDIEFISSNLPFVTPLTYPLKHDAIYLGYDESGWTGSSKITVKITDHETGKPIKVPLQFTTHDVDREKSGKGEEINNISNVTSIWGENDHYFNFGSNNQIVPSSSEGDTNYNNGSETRATWTTEPASEISFNYKSNNYGALAVVVSFPSNLERSKTCDTTAMKTSVPAPNTEVSIGDTIRYSLVLDNIGGSIKYKNIVLTDILDDSLTYKGNISANVTDVDGNVTDVTSSVVETDTDKIVLEYTEDLPVGTKLNISFDVVVTSYPPSGVINNVGEYCDQDGSGDCYQTNEIDHLVKESQGQVELYKVDENDQPLAGVEFTIYNTDGNAVGTLVTDSKGYAISSALPTGDYTIKETATVPGYELSTTVYDVTIINGEITTLTTDPIVNQPVNTSIEKVVSGVGDDAVATSGDELTYTINVTNESDVTSAINVPVRDSLLETLPSWLTLKGDVIVSPDTITTAGSLLDETFVIEEIPASSSVSITYTLVVGDIPNDVETIDNIAVNNDELIDVCQPTDEDCSAVIIPTEGDTVIEKTVEDGNKDGLAQVGEVLNYTLAVTNNTATTAHNVVVRDSLLEDLPTWLAFNSDVKVTPKDTVTSGDLTSGDFTISEIEAGQTVTITFSVTVLEIPNEIGNVINVATDDGQDPTIIDPEKPGVCEDDDCGSTITPVDPDTVIEKSVTGMRADGYANIGDTLTYSLEVTNPNKFAAATDVAVRDSLLEDIPTWLTFNNDVAIDPSDVVTSGDLTAGNFVISEIAASSSVTITYSMTVNSIPSDVTEVANVAVDDGSEVIDPDTNLPIICPPSSEDCSDTITPVDPETVIEKTVTGLGSDGFANVGDTLTYTLTVTNTSDVTSAIDVAVRDSLLEDIPTWLTFNDDITIDPSDVVTSGDLTKGNFVISEIAPSGVVTITYSLTMNSVPEEETNIANIATDTGDLIEICPPSDDDCASIIVPIDGETGLEKFLTDENGNGIAEDGEELYYTIKLTNPNSAAVRDVAVRDTLVEDIEAGLYPWLSLGDVVIDPNLEHTGSIQSGYLIFTEIPGNREVLITYTVTVGEIPNDVETIDNIATNDGTESCPDASADNCDTTTIPVEGDTVIKKAVTGMGADGYANVGDTLTYSLDITNNTAATAHNIPVRDSLLEDIPSWLQYNGDIAIDPSDTGYTGTPFDQTLVISQIEVGQTVTITYSMTVLEIPNRVSEVTNVATDDGQDPTVIDPEKPGVCEEEEDCSSTITPVEPETTIEKTVTGMGTDGYANIGDTLTYSLEVTNPNKLVAATDVAVRDSLLEDIPTWLTFNNDVALDPSDVVTSGDLTAGNFVISEIAANSSVTITYSMTVNSIPSDVTEVANVAVDDGSEVIDPDTNLPIICPPSSEDCSDTITPVDPETVIEKTVTGLGSDGFANVGDTLTYTLTVTNTSDVTSAIDVAVRDSLLEDIPTWLTFNDDITIDPSDVVTSGDLTKGNFVISEIAPSGVVTITYSLTMNSVPEEETNIANIATDTGDLIEICPPSDDDCASIIVPIDGETGLEKFLTDENGNGIAEDGEELYYTIKVTNVKSSAATNVEIRDTLVEQINNGSIDWLTYNDDMEVTPTDIKYSGDLATDDLVLTKVPGSSEVLITYSITVGEIPNDVETIDNIATNDGTETCPDTSADNCDTTTIPVEGDTVIEKTVEDGNKDGLAQVGEVLNYTLAVTNNTTTTAHNVVVRDSLLEDLPTWLAFNTDVKVTPKDTVTSGDLTSGDFTISQIEAGQTVTITYSVTVLEIPNEIGNVINVATDDGQDPTVIDPEKPGVCEDDDCGSTITPVDPDTVIEKSVTGMGADGYANIGDTLTYSLEVTNPNKFAAATDVAVRDSLLEDIPTWLTFNNDVAIDPSDVVTSGDLTAGNFVISEIAASSSVTITYSMTVNSIPSDVTEVANVAVDDGSEVIDPDTNLPIICPPSSEDCSDTITPVDPETVIEKTVTGLGSDGFANVGDTLTYTLTVTNTSDVTSAIDVAVRDSLLEDIPTWLTFNDDITIDPSDVVTSGDLTKGNFVISEIAPSGVVTITYSLTMNSVPEEETNIANIATDTGDLIEICPPSDDDCASIIVPIDGETGLEKFLTDENGNGIAEDGEELYYTIKLTNPNSAAVRDVAVRDTLVEDIEAGLYPWLSLGDVVIDPNLEHTGSIQSGDLIFTEIPGNSEVLITYTVTVGEIPNDVETIDNIATNDGTETCPDTSADNCDTTTIPVEGDTVIEKTVEDGNKDGLAQVGEVLNYTLAVTNNTATTAHNVVVRDSLLEDLPTWLAFNTDVKVTPKDTVTSGDLTSGDFTISEIEAGQTVTITFSVTVLEIPNEIGNVINVATDDGQDPTVIDPEKPGVCEDDDCGSTITPVDPDTVIEKSVTGMGADGYANIGDTLTYSLEVTNPNKFAAATDVAVRDSLLEDIPTWLTFNNDVAIDPSDVVTSGDLTAGNFVISEIAASSSVTITYSMTVNSIPSDVTEVANVAVDDGSEVIDPDTNLPIICPPSSEDCSDTITPVDPETVIEKTVTGLGSDGFANVGDTLTYTLTVTNTSDVTSAIDVAVRDSLLEDIPTWLTFNDDITIDPSDVVTSGDLTAGNFVISEIAPSGVVTITYSLTMNSVPEEETNIANIATDTGDLIEICPPSDDDCASIIVPIDGETGLEKFLTDENGNGIAEDGEELYYTIKVTNVKSSAATNVEIRDTLVEQINNGSIDWLTYNDDMEVTPTDIKYSGDLATDDLVLTKVPGSSEVLITYSITVGEIPNDVETIDNIATNDGTETCPDTSADNCDTTTIPVEGDTVIEKTVEDGNKDGLAQVGEVLNYTLAVTNNTATTAHNVVVRDSLLEDLPTWLAFNTDVKVTPKDTVTSGDLTSGDFTISEIEAGQTVTITFSVTVLEIPNEIGNVINVATDDGQDPTVIDPEKPGVCEDDDCGSTITPVDPDTVIEKSVTGMGADGYANIGDTLTYSLEVTNPNKFAAATDVAVRDSLLEDIPTWLTFNNDVAIDPSDVVTSGDLTKGNFVISEIAANSSVTITYSMTVNSIPSDVTEVANVAVDDGSEVIDPDTNLPIICPPSSEDCSDTITPVDPETVIEKTVTGLGSDGFANVGDTLTYTLTVTNTSDVTSAIDVAVRDSLLEDIPTWLTFNDDVTIDPSDVVTSGDLTKGNFVISEIAPRGVVTITYSLTMNSVPDDANQVKNIATDTGDLIEICPPNDDDCASIIVPIDGQSKLEKFLTDENGNGIAENGEELFYTIKVVNDSGVDVHNLPIRDTLIENHPSWLVYNENMVVNPNLASTGDLESGDFAFDVVPANSEVLITYSFTVTHIPADAIEIPNIATSDGTDVCEDPTSDTCDTAVIPVEGNTVIQKSSSDASGDGILQVGERVDYTISVGNYTEAVAHNVAVRDSMLEEFPVWIKFNNDITIDPSDLAYSGSLLAGDFVIDEIAPMQKVTITYSVNILAVPANASDAINIATDDGSLDKYCPRTTQKDCVATHDSLDPNTVIDKSVTGMGVDGYADVGDVLQFQIDVTNKNKFNDAIDVAVRDSLLEDTPDYLVFNNDVYVNPEDVSYSGDMTKGNFVLSEVKADSTVSITYSMTVLAIPDDVASIDNIATDNGRMPEVCINLGLNCDSTITPVNPETVIEKTVDGLGADGFANVGDTLTYRLNITNPNTVTSAIDVAVRDSLLENIPTWLTFNDDVIVDPNDVVTSGNLTDGNFVISEIAQSQTVSITYSLTLNSIPTDVASIDNIATDTGDLIEVCPPSDDDCSMVISPIDGETALEKFISDENGNGVAEEGETLYYTLKLDNLNSAVAENVEIRDTLVEQINNGTIDWLTYNDDMEITPTDIKYSGDLATNDLVLSEVPGLSEVLITYSITVGEIPNDVETIDNIATNDGTETCPDASADNCDTTTIPVEGDTVIKKAVTGMGADGYANVGDTLTYSLDITNNTTAAAHNIAVRDSLLEDIPSWLQYNGDIAIDPSDTGYTGTPFDQTLVISQIEAGQTVTITYSMTVLEIPNKVSEVTNVATDDGQDPTVIDPEKPGVCEEEEDCSSTITPVEPETTIEKSVTGMGTDGYANIGDTLTYSLVVTNPNKLVAAHDIAVRDSLLEDIPTWLTFNNDVAIDPSDIVYSGDLTAGNFVISEIAANSSVTITYSMTINSIPSDVTEVANVAVDDGSEVIDPDTNLPIICPPSSEDCSDTITPVDPETVIEKTVTGLGSDGFANVGDTLTYTLTVTNTSDVTSAIDVAVRDSLLEDIPTWLTFNDDVRINPETTVTTGNLTEGDFVIGEIEPNATVEVSYSLTVHDIPDGVSSITNVAVDNGGDLIDPDTNLPIICPPSNEDCSETISPVDPETVVEKTVTGMGSDGIADIGDKLVYTINVSNTNTTVPALNVEVKDSILETLDENDWLTFNDDITIEPEDIVTSGSLLDGTFVIDEIAPNSEVSITYSLAVNSRPDEITNVHNVVTDNGDEAIDPDNKLPIVCPKDSVDCSETVTPIKPIEPETPEEVISEDENIPMTIVNTGANYITSILLLVAFIIGLYILKLKNSK